MTARAEKKSNATSTKDRSRGRVLLVADEEQGLLADALHLRRIDVVGVSTATAALVSLQRSRPHVVIANPQAQGLRDNELARMLAQNGDGVPLILAGSSPATLELRKSALASGAFDYFELPREFDLLVFRTEQLVALRQKIDRLRSDADLDALTGLANRRRFRSALKGELERWRRHGTPCALLYIDIDHLKQINDNYGHLVGDMVIRQIAQILSEASRDNDTAARLGGEEFALLLAGIDVDRAAAAAERLREAIGSRRMEGVGRVTVSIGLAGCPASANSERSLYAASDEALYVAKNGGRDRVAVAPRLQENLPGVESDKQ
jgi:diguanylate cyclase (GGDEF)-like protein